MSAINLNNSNFVFCPPEPGKPNPKEPKIPGTTRSRVFQSEQKGPTCSYYAMQILRNEHRIGKKLRKDFLTVRHFEKQLSIHRKNSTEQSNKWKCFGKFERLIAEKYPENFTKTDAQELINSHFELINQMDSKYQESICKILQDFSIQEEHEKLFTYTKAKRIEERILIDVTFLKRYNPDHLEEDLNLTCKNTIGKSWENAGLHEKYVCTHNLVFNFACKAYNIKKSSWHPSNPINNLIEQLNLHGPHMVAGYFGKGYYEEVPFELKERIEGRPIFKWLPNTNKNLENLPGHSIVIIGARGQGKSGYVYFLDPQDSSDPNNLLSQKVYMIPYAKFISLIGDLHGKFLKPNGNGPRFTEIEKNNYALHM